MKSDIVATARWPIVFKVSESKLGMKRGAQRRLRIGAAAFVNGRVCRVDRRDARKALQWEVSRRAIAVRDNLTLMTHVSVADILALPVQERIHLVEMIWESIAAFPEAIAVSPELKSELDARLADFERNPEEGYSWDQVKEQLKNGSWRTA